MGEVFGPTTTKYAHKSFSVQIKFPNTCLVSGDTSTPRDLSVLKGDYYYVLTVEGDTFNSRVPQPEHILMELQELSDGSAVSACCVRLL